MNQPMTMPQGLNTTNTYVSVALMIVVISGALWIRDSVGKAETSVTTARMEITNRMDKSDTKFDDLVKRVDKFEQNKESWSYQDMFKWAVRLQRENPTLKVPEPESKQ